MSGHNSKTVSFSRYHNVVLPCKDSDTFWHACTQVQLWYLDYLREKYYDHAIVNRIFEHCHIFAGP